MSEAPDPQISKPFAKKLIALYGVSFFGAALLIWIYSKETARALDIEIFQAQLLAGALGFSGLANMIFAIYKKNKSL